MTGGIFFAPFAKWTVTIGSGYTAIRHYQRTMNGYIRGCTVSAEEALPARPLRRCAPLLGVLVRDARCPSRRSRL